MHPELTVIVPVLDRPANVEPLVTSFLENCPPDSHLMFVATDGDKDELDAVRASLQDRIYLLLTKRISWPNKINEAFLKVRDHTDWVLFGADDIAFHEGWFEQTKPFRDQDEIMVIGTNDLGNPRVIAGDHSTHTLVRASYLGTIDDPNAIVHTGYRHTFVDDELLWTAKLRGVWVHCPSAVVEHLHPYWNKSRWDSTYAQGDLSLKHDGRLWRKRCKLLGLEWVS